jgi:hypothetical protein
VEFPNLIRLLLLTKFPTKFFYLFNGLTETLTFLRRAFQLFSVVGGTFSITKNTVALFVVCFSTKWLMVHVKNRTKSRYFIPACGSVRYKRHAAIDIETTLDNNCRDSATPTPTMVGGGVGRHAPELFPFHHGTRGSQSTLTRLITTKARQKDSCTTSNISIFLSKTISLHRTTLWTRSIECVREIFTVRRRECRREKHLAPLSTIYGTLGVGR